jgi:hypothetical protein
MEILLHWIREHGFDLVGTVGVIASLSFTTFTVRKDEKARNISNLLALTSEHRDIWTAFYERPSLARVLSTKVDVRQDPVTDEESIFVTFLILHLSATYEAIQAGVFSTGQAVAEDIRWFFSLPIPQDVWERSKPFQDKAFAAFVDECRK